MLGKNSAWILVSPNSNLWMNKSAGMRRSQLLLGFEDSDWAHTALEKAYLYWPKEFCSPICAGSHQY